MHLSPRARFFLLTGSGFGFGLLMFQFDFMARRLGLFVEFMDFIHAPAIPIADIIFSLSRLGIGNPTLSTSASLQVPGLAALRFIPYGIVVEWTLLGALTGSVWSLWRLHGSAKS